MSVFVSDFGDGTTWTVTHDDAPGGMHDGTIDPATVLHPLRPDGTPDHNYAVITCPVCGSVSTHPVGGG
ncbi:MAG: hypothetical protein J2P17_29355, partial [Mycobacterium sp.]|nr:hypothetical protein [Mycobacterium sp.]